MPKKLPPLLYGTLALGIAFFATEAHAGFQWVAPDSNAYQQPVTVGGAPSVSVATGAPEVISPVIISGGDNIVSRPPTSSMPIVVPASRPNQPMNMATATIAIPATSSEVVQGFATQIPLPLALRQILPIGISFSIDQSIDMETLVSYKGGKTWRETLSDMLAAVGLVAHEQGQTVTVSRLADARNNVPNVMPVAQAEVSPVAVVHGADLSAVNVGAPDGWSAQRGDTLRKVLTEWCKRDGVELQWVAEYDYPMEASANFGGDFEDAVRNLLAGFENARPQPVAELHTNPNAGQKLLVVQARGNSYSN